MDAAGPELQPSLAEIGRHITALEYAPAAATLARLRAAIDAR